MAALHDPEAPSAPAGDAKKPAGVCSVIGLLVLVAALVWALQVYLLVRSGSNDDWLGTTSTPPAWHETLLNYHRLALEDRAILEKCREVERGPVATPADARRLRECQTYRQERAGLVSLFHMED